MQLYKKYKRKEDNVIFPWLQKNLKLGKTIVDIGARKGNWYREIAVFFPDSPAYLFEPTPNIVEHITHKFKKSTQYIHDVALSNELGTLDFHIDLEQGGWSGLTKQRETGLYETIQVPVRTLDSFNLDNVGLIKIDVEGNELKTLQGAEQTIKNSMPFVYFECADVHMVNYDYSSGDVFDFFNNLNMEILDLDLNICSREKLQKHTASKSSFYHNFIAKSK